MFIANSIWVSSGLSVASMQLFSSKFFAFVLWYFVVVFAWTGKRMKRGRGVSCLHYQYSASFAYHFLVLSLRLLFLLPAVAIAIYANTK